MGRSRIDWSGPDGHTLTFWGDMPAGGTKMTGRCEEWIPNPLIGNPAGAKNYLAAGLGAQEIKTKGTSC